jgi:hypothetical protein
MSFWKEGKFKKFNLCGFSFKKGEYSFIGLKDLNEDELSRLKNLLIDTYDWVDWNVTKITFKYDEKRAIELNFMKKYQIHTIGKHIVLYQREEELNLEEMKEISQVFKLNKDCVFRKEIQDPTFELVNQRLPIKHEEKTIT